MDREAERLTKGACLALLRAQHERLRQSGEDRYPKRGDFSPQEVEAIKAFLGPWPRALEKAGIKPPRNDGRLEKNREKRIRAKRARNAARRAAKHLKTENAKNELLPEGDKK